MAVPSLTGQGIDQCLSKHQEVGFTPGIKVTRVFGVFWDLLVAIKVNPERYVSTGSYELQ